VFTADICRVYPFCGLGYLGRCVVRTLSARLCKLQRRSAHLSTTQLISSVSCCRCFSCNAALLWCVLSAQAFVLCAHACGADPVSIIFTGCRDSDCDPIRMRCSPPVISSINTPLSQTSFVSLLPQIYSNCVTAVMLRYAAFCGLCAFQECEEHCPEEPAGCLFRCYMLLPPWVWVCIWG
jgi:hypothetical protein